MFSIYTLCRLCIGGLQSSGQSRYISEITKFVSPGTEVYTYIV